MRDAAALELIPALQAGGAQVSAYDPVAMDNGRATFEEVRWCADAYSAAMDTDAVVILTEWNAFRGLDLQKLAKSMRRPVMVDFRNLFSLKDVEGLGLTYHSLGRRSVMADPKDRMVIVNAR